MHAVPNAPRNRKKNKTVAYYTLPSPQERQELAASSPPHPPLFTPIVIGYACVAIEKRTSHAAVCHSDGHACGQASSTQKNHGDASHLFASEVQAILC